MKQNIYDNTGFYEAYVEMRKNRMGLNEDIEHPAFKSLFPDLKSKTILDLGCGYGEFCKWFVTKGAKKVVGIDISKNMIKLAKEIYYDPNIKYQNIAMEDMEFDNNSFDLVSSSLAFQYVAHYKELIEKIYKYLKKGGFLIFSFEHPILTARKVETGWITNRRGNKIHWIMDNYSEEGKREQKWLKSKVIKYHRTVSTVINTLIDRGFDILRILEPIASEEAEKKRKSLIDEKRRPPFMIVKCVKK